MRSVALPALVIGALAWSACGSGGEDPGENNSSGETTAVAPAPGSKTLRDPDLPFTFQYPPPFMEARSSPALPTVLAAVLLDRRNAIVVTDFGTELPPDEFGEALERKLQDGGFEGELSRQEGREVTTFSAVLDSESFSQGGVAGTDVGAKRYWFSGAGGSWEISCQFTGEKRREVLDACDQIAGTLSLE
jgi:hypothetical protein